MDSPDPLSLNNSLGAHIRRAERVMHRVLRHHLAAHDIPVGMWYFLRVLWEQDGLAQREIGARVGATGAATAEQLRNMETRGLIRRAGSGTDKRSKEVRLTQEGRLLRDVLIAYPQEIEAHALAGLSIGEISFLRMCLTQLCTNLAAYEAELGGP